MKRKFLLTLTLIISNTVFGNANKELEKLINNYYNNGTEDLLIRREPTKEEWKNTRNTVNTNRNTSTIVLNNGYLESKSLGIKLSQKELREIADRIYRNETGGNLSELVAWNEGENFPSLGIGHFTWLRAGQKTTFGDSFSGLISFYRSKGVKLPKLLENYSTSPWRSRSELLSKKNNGDRDIWELIRFFDETRDYQVMYIFQRLENSLNNMLNASYNRENLRNQFFRVAKSPNGVYALIDYVNFKGEGIGTSRSYNNQGWGLRQVLENMNGSEEGRSAIVEFANSAKMVLSRRVRNAPRNESRWLAGWNNRIDTYTYGR